MCNNLLRRPTNHPPPPSPPRVALRITFPFVQPQCHSSRFDQRSRNKNIIFDNALNFIKMVCWYLQVQRNPPALSTSQVSHNHNRREWQCACHARRPGISIHTRGATATNESEKYSRWTCSFCVVAHSKKEWKKKKRAFLHHVSLPRSPRRPTSSFQSVYSMHAHSRFFFSFHLSFFLLFFLEHGRILTNPYCPLW